MHRIMKAIDPKREEIVGQVIKEVWTINTEDGASIVMVELGNGMLLVPHDSKLEVAIPE